MMKSSSALPTRWFLISAVNFLLAAILGAILRYAYIDEVPLPFTHIKHAHSHLAMLGWVYLALYTLLIRYFLPQGQTIYKGYRTLFWLTQLTVIGMFISFLIQGYGSVSIVFSSLHIIFSYFFIYRFWKDLGPSREGNTISYMFVRASLVFMIISSLGIWAMPIIIALSGAGTAWYYGAVQFYLHFQFNGWFIFAILSLLFSYMENRGIVFNKSKAILFFRLLTFSCVLTYLLAVTWSTPIPALFYINGAGVIIQLLALAVFYRLIKSHINDISSKLSRPLKWLLIFGFACFAIKIVMQSAVVLPVIAKIGYTIRNYVIGFLHLMLLGLVSASLLFFAAKEGIFKFSGQVNMLGLIVFLAGFVTSEILLFVQGTMLWASMGFMPGYYILLFGFSACIPMGILLMLISQKKESTNRLN